MPTYGKLALPDCDDKVLIPDLFNWRLNFDSMIQLSHMFPAETLLNIIFKVFLLNTIAERWIPKPWNCVHSITPPHFVAVGRVHSGEK